MLQCFRFWGLFPHANLSVCFVCLQVDIWTSLSFPTQSPCSFTAFSFSALQTLPCSSWQLSFSLSAFSLHPSLPHWVKWKHALRAWGCYSNRLTHHLVCHHHMSSGFWRPEPDSEATWLGGLHRTALGTHNPTWDFLFLSALPLLLHGAVSTQGEMTRSSKKLMKGKSKWNK